MKRRTPFERGRLAYCDGFSSAANPFRKGSEAYKQWLHGWSETSENDPLKDEDEEACDPHVEN